MLVVKVVGYIQRNHLKLTVISVICDLRKKHNLYHFYFACVNFEMSAMYVRRKFCVYFGHLAPSKLTAGSENGTYISVSR